MARKKKRNRSGQRDDFPIARPLLPVPKPVVRPLVSDRRLFHPDPVAPVYSPRKSQRRVVEVGNVPRPSKKRNAVVKQSRGYKFSFAVPKAVDLCVRRKRRREVMFALRRTGKGSRKLHRRRNYWSGVTCR